MRPWGVGVAFSVDGVEDLVQWEDIGDRVVRRIAEDEFAAAAPGLHHGRVMRHVNQRRRAVEAGAVGAGQELEEEQRVLLAAGRRGLFAAAAHAQVADVVAFGVAPDVVALLLERDLGQLARLAVQLASEGDGFRRVTAIERQ